MRCAWKELLSILPNWMRAEVDELGRETLQELRLRLGLPPELIRRGGDKQLCRLVTGDDIHYIVNAASKYSPWSAATIAAGYITAPGGHRIGLCGEAVIHHGQMTGLRKVTSLCIRVARDFPGIAADMQEELGSVLIIGRPGSGKTTYLRDLIRFRSEKMRGSVAVVDERNELFPAGIPAGSRTDILVGCSKTQGIDTVLRTMGPHTIAVDEITSDTDCVALQKAGWCGVTLLATAHAGSLEDLYTRPVYKPLLSNHLFRTVVILQSHGTRKVERIPV